MLSKYSWTNVVFGTTAIALLCTAIGCVGYVERPRSRSAHVVQPVVVEEDYVYYPEYQVYYGRHSRQYYYQEGSSWVARPAPASLSVSLLISSPAVPMAFHDEPAAHHSEVIRAYPVAASRGRHDQRDKHNDKEDSRDEKRHDR